MAALITLPYLGLVAIKARCSLRWFIAGMMDTMFGMPPLEKKSVAFLKTCDGSMISQKKSVHQVHTLRMLSRPGRQDWVIGLIFTCRTAGFLLATHDIISSFLPIVVAKYFFTLPAPSPSFLPLPSPSGTSHSRLLYVLLASGSFCTLPTCSR
jgi:hypothetical protein